VFKYSKRRARERQPPGAAPLSGSPLSIYNAGSNLVPAQNDAESMGDEALNLRVLDTLAGVNPAE